MPWILASASSLAMVLTFCCDSAAVPPRPKRRGGGRHRRGIDICSHVGYFTIVPRNGGYPTREFSRIASQCCIDLRVSGRIRWAKSFVCEVHADERNSGANHFSDRHCREFVSGGAADGELGCERQKDCRMVVCRYGTHAWARRLHSLRGNCSAILRHGAKPCSTTTGSN